MTGRVTELGNVSRFTDWGSAARQRLAEAEQQIASGRQYERPSEAPVQAGQILQSRHRLARLQQFVRNQSSANEWLQSSDAALQSSNAALTRARTLALQAVNASTTDEGRDAIAAEIRSVAREVLALSNTSVDGRPIFAGTHDGTSAYDDTGAYLGDTGAVRRRVDDNLTLQVGNNGPAVFGTDNAGEAGVQAFYMSHLGMRLAQVLLGVAMLRMVKNSQKRIQRTFDAITHGWNQGRTANSFATYDWWANLRTPLAQVREELGVVPASAELSAGRYADEVARLAS